MLLLKLKQAMCEALTLALLNFSKLLMLEIDANNYGVGVVSMW